ncbi:MAG: ABC transporter permease [Desulfamplus sp.]|nr:ABC transporter permease [Desulfamplus sp.]
MAKFIIRRFFLLVLTMFLVSIAVFLIVESSPGNIAKNVLGAFITPEQEASFLAQQGLDKPLFQRYWFWLVGSDRVAERKCGFELERIETASGFQEWWAKGENGSLMRWNLEGQDLIVYIRKPNTTAKTISSNNSEIAIEKRKDNERWIKAKDGSSIFWGIDRNNHAVLWVKGASSEVWNFVVGTGWIKSTGGPQSYIPLKKGFLRGDFGVSLRTGRPVEKSLFIRLRNSVVLAGIAFVVVMPIALLLGMVAGINEGSFQDRFLSIAGMIFSVIPEFATGIFLILIMAHWLELVPGASVFGEKAPWQRPDMLILPVLTLTLIELGYVLRITRASMAEVMRSAYIRTAFLKGLPFWKVIFRHAAKNALIAPITVIMLHVNWLMGGIVIVEVVFGYPGLGQYLLDSALYKDVNAIEAGTMIMVLLAVGTQLFADVLYTFLNPRIRYS